MNHLDELKKLHELLKDGFLSQEEFDAEKANLLASKNTEAQVTPSSPKQEEEWPESTKEELKRLDTLIDELGECTGVSQWTGKDDRAKVIRKFSVVQSRPGIEKALSVLIGFVGERPAHPMWPVPEVFTTAHGVTRSLARRLDDGGPGWVEPFDEALHEMEQVQAQAKTEHEEQQKNTIKWGVGLIGAVGCLGLVFFAFGVGGEEDAKIEQAQAECKGMNSACDDLCRISACSFLCNHRQTSTQRENAWACDVLEALKKKTAQ